MTPTRLKYIISLSALVLLLIHVIWPEVTVDGVTLVLLGLSIVPWLTPLFKAVEFPGGWKLEFQDLERMGAKAEALGLVSPPEPGDGEHEYAFQLVAPKDPNLALAGLRIEIETRLRRLADENGIEEWKGRDLSTLLGLLSQATVLSSQEATAFSDLAGLIGMAVHGAQVDTKAANWAMQVGPRLLRSLDARLST